MRKALQGLYFIDGENAGKFRRKTGEAEGKKSEIEARLV